MNSFRSKNVDIYFAEKLGYFTLLLLIEIKNNNTTRVGFQRDVTFYSTFYIIEYFKRRQFYNSHKCFKFQNISKKLTKSLTASHTHIRVDKSCKVPRRYSVVWIKRPVSSTRILYNIIVAEGENLEKNVQPNFENV